MSTETPTTRREIRERLNKIAPYPKHDTPDQASAVAKYLAVAAQRGWKYTLDIADMGSAEYMLSVQAMFGDFAALHLLRGLIESNPTLAEELSRQIRNAWDDGGDIGPWLWEHATALGIDTDEVSRLEVTWWAAGKTPATTGETP